MGLIMQWLEVYLKKSNMIKIAEKDTRPRKWNAGEVDLLAWDRRRAILWVIEIKEHRKSSLGYRELLSEAQKKRLMLACGFYRSLYPHKKVGFALLWRDPETSRLEFLENP